MGRLIVGAPVFERGWMLDHWFRHLSMQWEWEDDLTVVLNYGPGEDDTLDIIENAERNYGFKHVALLYDLHKDHHAGRTWNENRYATMVRLRNKLLEYVRQQQPEFYLSCDTDMLLPPEAVLKLAQELGRVGADGIAPLTYMTPNGTQFPNCMNQGGVTRPPVQDDTFFVGACFGVVLMAPSLYNGVDYAVHPNGEDLGWAENARVAGMKLALTPHVKVKHVMNPAMLGPVDERIGF